MLSQHDFEADDPDYGSAFDTTHTYGPPREGLAHITIKLEAASGYESESIHPNITPEQYGQVMAILHGKPVVAS